MKKTAEEMLDELQVLVEGIGKKLENKQTVEIINEKKNSHLHLLLETSLMNKLQNEANGKCISVAELCRRKLRFNERDDIQLNTLKNIIKRLENIENNIKLISS